MSKPYIHAKSSAKKFGGKPEDYMGLHCFLDSSKSVVPSNIHRALTHNSWFIMVVIPRVFGETFKNSDRKVVSSRDIAENHVLEDFGSKFIPTAQDFLQEIEFKDWMQNGNGYPPSFQKIQGEKKITKKFPFAPNLEPINDVTYDGSHKILSERLID